MAASKTTRFLASIGLFVLLAAATYVVGALLSSKVVLAQDTTSSGIKLVPGGTTNVCRMSKGGILTCGWPNATKPQLQGQAASLEKALNGGSTEAKQWRCPVIEVDGKLVIACQYN